MTIAYLNGEFLPLEEARIPAMDRGFLFGDSVYEVIPVYKGQLFRFQQHITRLQRSLHATKLQLDMDGEQWDQLLHEVVKRNGGGEQSLYLQVSRGPVAQREHVFPQVVSPTIFAYSMPLPPLDLDTLRQGIAAITLTDNRWQGCFIKSTNLLANVLLRMQAAEQQAQEAILIRQDKVAEGTASNVFIVLDQQLITSPLVPTILGGVTRDLVIELAQQQQMPLNITPISAEQLNQASEIWLTSSTKHIRPVITLDGNPVGSGKAGPMWEQMIQYYQAYCQQLTS